MKKWLLLLLSLTVWLLAGLVLFAGRPAGSDNILPMPHTRPERIVSMAPNLTEILYALGLADSIAAVSADSNFPPDAATKPSVGDFWQPDIEAVVAARPDMVITLGFEQQRELARRLNRLGYSCLSIDIDNVSEFFEALKIIGAFTDTRDRADELAAAMKNELDSLCTLLRSEKPVKVLWVVQREPLRVAGRDTFINQIIELAGGENAIGPSLHKYPPTGAEQIVACRPDVIIEVAMDNNNLQSQEKSAVRYYSRFANTPAIGSGRVHVIPPDTVSRLSPRLCQGVRLVGRLIRPQAFGDKP